MTPDAAVFLLVSSSVFSLSWSVLRARPRRALTRVLMAARRGHGPRAGRRGRVALPDLIAESRR